MYESDLKRAGRQALLTIVADQQTVIAELSAQDRIAAETLTIEWMYPTKLHDDERLLGTGRPRFGCCVCESCLNRSNRLIMKLA